VSSLQIGIEIGPTLYAAFMVFARVTAMLHTLPLFSMAAVPVPVRAGLGALIALVISPWVAVEVSPSGWEVTGFAVSLASEIFLGAAMGFAVRLMMAIIDVLGTVLAANCGLGMASQFDPVSQSQGLIISRLVQTAGFLVFLSLNLHHEVLAGLVGSFSVAPPGEGVLAFTAGPLFSEIYGQMLHDTARLSMPLVVAVLFFNMVSALVTRFAQQMNIYFSIGLSANVWAGLMAIGASIPALIATILNRTQGMGGVMRLLAGG
jgi:flagellar biosynthetic protein FliR